MGHLAALGGWRQSVPLPADRINLGQELVVCKRGEWNLIFPAPSFFLFLFFFLVGSESTVNEDVRQLGPGAHKFGSRPLAGACLLRLVPPVARQTERKEGKNNNTKAELLHIFPGNETQTCRCTRDMLGSSTWPAAHSSSKPVPSQTCGQEENREKKRIEKKRKKERKRERRRR
jgi:hypothetical protein